MLAPRHAPPYSVAILVFDGVEVLDFTGPFEVFSRTRTVPGLESRRSDEHAPFRPFTVAKSRDVVTATGGLKIVPEHSFDSAPEVDLLLVPGGFGTRALLEDPVTLEWITVTAKSANWSTSVCTGALLLAARGLLRERSATTHWCALDRLAELEPRARVEADRRFVDDGIVTSAGVAAGIDMAFHVVETLCGKDVADETARYIEYPRAPSSRRHGALTEAVRAIYAAFAEGDTEAILARLAEDVEWEYGGEGEAAPWLSPRRGRDAAAGFFSSLSAFRLERFEPKEFLEGPDVVVVLLDVEMRLAASGERLLEEDEIHVWRFDEAGLVRRFRHGVDTHRYAEALRRETESQAD